MESTIQNDLASFRDPAGFIFEKDGQIFRSISTLAKNDFDQLISSGLYGKLSQAGELVSHEEVSFESFNLPANTYKVLKPERISVITYPYEWSFSQLKDAALLTLDLQKTALEHDLSLKDASAFNVQFMGSRPIFIDTLSFEHYSEGKPWVAYRQFCEHFLAPLLLSAKLGVWYQSLLKNSIDGVSLPAASQMLPWHTWLNPASLFHIHLHAKSIRHYSKEGGRSTARTRNVPKRNLFALVDHLQGFIRNLHLRKSDSTQWKDYDQQTHYSSDSRSNKAKLVSKFIAKANPGVMWDIGGNDGHFSRLGTRIAKVILSMDADPLAVEKNYLHCKNDNLQNVYSLVADFVNPSANIGWANTERTTLARRSKPDLILALALIHHIVITHNIPFKMVSHYLADLSEWLVIEFVPFEDEKIRPLPDTAGKKNYNRENFERAFFSDFTLIAEEKIEGSLRSLLLLKRIKR